MSRCYNAARDIIHHDIYEVDPIKTFLTPTDFFLYCYYSARIAIGLKVIKLSLYLINFLCEYKNRIMEEHVKCFTLL